MGDGIGDLSQQFFVGPREYLNKGENDLYWKIKANLIENPALKPIREGIEDILPMFPIYEVSVTRRKVLVRDERGEAILNLWRSIVGWQGSTDVNSRFMSALIESPKYGLPCRVDLIDAPLYEPRLELF